MQLGTCTPEHVDTWPGLRSWLPNMSSSSPSLQYWRSKKAGLSGINTDIWSPILCMQWCTKKSCYYVGRGLALCFYVHAINSTPCDDVFMIFSATHPSMSQDNESLNKFFILALDKMTLLPILTMMRLSTSCWWSVTDDKTNLQHR